MEPLTTSLHPIITLFLSGIEYKQPPKLSNDALLDAMRAKAAQIEVPLDNDHSVQCFMGAFGVAGHLYPGHPLEIQVYAGILTWLSYLIDDKTSESEMKTDVTRFQERFYSGGEQPTCLLRGYAKLLRSTYDHFDNVVANFLILSVLAFVNSNVLENRDEFNSMTPTKGGGKFWWYCRDKSGLAEAYVYLTFHQAHYPDISAFLEAVPDMCIFTNLTNEILSFYKEEKAGERKNYLHNRADCENKEVLDVLREVVEECVEAFQRGQVILHGTEQYAQGWQTFALGLVACHKAIDRYRLSEIGLEEKYDEA